MANYSKDPRTVLKDALDKSYRRVRFQQGKPVLDRDLNLLGDLADPQRLAQQYVGDGVPAGSDGFAVGGLNVPANDFTIAGGRCLVAGLEAAAVNTTYRTQPNTGHVQPLPAGASNVYLHVFPTEVDSTQDATLKNPGDVGFETAIRERVDWEVVVSAQPINAPDIFLLAVINTTNNTVADRRRTALTLSALRDEVSGARGSMARLDMRLDTVLAADGSLKTKSIPETALGDLAVSMRTVADGAIPIQKLAAALVFSGQVSVPAAPGPNQSAELVVNLAEAEDPGFFLVSAHFDGPRPHLLPPIPRSAMFEWHQRALLVKPPGLVYHHVYQLVIQNPNTFAISVTCKAYRLSES